MYGNYGPSIFADEDLQGFISFSKAIEPRPPVHSAVHRKADFDGGRRRWFSLVGYMKLESGGNGWR